MKSDDIKILKIKPIKKGIEAENESVMAETTMTSSPVFYNNENAHFFNQKPKLHQLHQHQVSNSQYQTLNSENSREMRINLDNPNALKVLQNHAEKLEQERSNFHQRLDKIKDTFNEVSPFSNDDYLKEELKDSKQVNLSSFNQNLPHRVIENDRIEVDRSALKVQAHAIAQKIVQKENTSKLGIRKTGNGINKITKTSLTAEKTLPKNLGPKATNKNVFFTQSYNKPSSTSALQSNNVNDLEFKNSDINETNDEKNEKNINLNKGINLEIPQSKQINFYDELNVMQWDQTKRPNLDVDQTTNKYFHEEESGLEYLPRARRQREEANIISPTPAPKELNTQPTEISEINNFYTSLFNPSKTKQIKTRLPKVKRISSQTVSLNSDSSSNKIKKTVYRTNKSLDYNYHIRYLANGRQRINKVKKNNLATWNNSYIAIARIMSIIGLLLFTISFLVFSGWINNPALDLYHFFEQLFGKLPFISFNQNYFLANRTFMMFFITLYLIIVLIPFCWISNYKVQMYFLLPFNLLIILLLSAIAIYGYITINTFSLVNGSFQVGSLVLMLLANIIMFIGILKMKSEKIWN